MKKSKILFVISACLLIPLAGFLIINSIYGDGKKKAVFDGNEASASQVSQDDNSSGEKNNISENSPENTYNPSADEYDDNNIDVEDNDMNDDYPSSDVWIPATEMDLDPTSITTYVNKEYALPKDYVPDDLTVPDVKFDITGFEERKQMRKEAALALERLFIAAKKDGYELCAISGYRSYERQKTIFLNNIVTRGKSHTLKYSAVPGTSEHQTGLSMDLSSKSMKYRLITTFSSSPEGKWIAENAHKYGYIVRYPEDRIDITGYAYEPWHIRYVGRNLAAYLYENNMTLDEYYKYKPGEGFDFEAIYAEYINYKPPVTPTPIPHPVTIIPAGTVLEGELILPAKAVISGSITLVKDLKLEDGTVLSEGSVLSGNIILPENSVINCVVVLPVEVNIEDGIVLPEGAVIADGDPLPDGTYLECSLSLPAGTVLESGLLLPKGTRLEKAVLEQDITMPGFDSASSDSIENPEVADDTAMTEEGPDYIDDPQPKVDTQPEADTYTEEYSKPEDAQPEDDPDKESGSQPDNNEESGSAPEDTQDDDTQNDEGAQNDEDTKNGEDTQNGEGAQNDEDTQDGEDTQNGEGAQNDEDTKNGEDTATDEDQIPGDVITLPEDTILGNLKLPKGTTLNLGSILPEGAVLDFGTVVYMQWTEYDDVEDSFSPGDSIIINSIDMPGLIAPEKGSKEEDEGNIRNW